MPGSGQPEWPRPAWPNPEWPAAPATSPGWGSPPPPVPPPPAPPGNEEIGIGPNTRCYEHPDKLAGSICRSCNKPICADCMVQAPVGWQCRQCVRKNAKKSPVIRYRPGTGSLPTLSQVPLTMAIIAICVVLFVASSANPNLLNQTAMESLEVNAGQWYRLFTSIFFHVNFLHIGLNMVSLLIIGRLVEPVLGKWRYLALFIVSGLGGSVACYLLTYDPSVGASGAIFGLFGAYFVLARRARADASGIGVLIAINLFYSFVVPGISWQDHIGGLVTGVVLAAAFGLGRRGRGHRELVADILAVAGVSVALGLLLLLPPAVVNLG